MPRNQDSKDGIFIWLKVAMDFPVDEDKIQF